MIYDTTARHRTRPAGLLAIAFRPWQMFAGIMTERRNYAQLSGLDDHLLKDIGISRGSIRSALRQGRDRD
jgi:uncharacterized protein YjiS (DUF1127 family)